MVVLDFHGPVGSEAVFNARASQPSAIRVGIGKRYAGRHIGDRSAIIYPTAATLAVEQPIVCRIASAARNGGKPIGMCTALENIAVYGGYRIARLAERCPIEHRFNAENKLGRDLPVVADLTATNESRMVAGETCTCEIIGQRAAGPRASQIAADIKTSPIIDRHNDRRRRRFPNQ